MHSVGASSVHSSYSDGLIRDMPVIADLNITDVSEIQDFKKIKTQLTQHFKTQTLILKMKIHTTFIKSKLTKFIIKKKPLISFHQSKPNNQKPKPPISKISIPQNTKKKPKCLVTSAVRYSSTTER